MCDSCDSWVGDHEVPRTWQTAGDHACCCHKGGGRGVGWVIGIGLFSTAWMHGKGRGRGHCQRAARSLSTCNNISDLGSSWNGRSRLPAASVPGDRSYGS